MWRHLLLPVLLLSALSASVPPVPVVAEPAGARHVYLPLVIDNPLELVVTARKDGPARYYGDYNQIVGYVRNLTSTPLYAVTVGIEVTDYPYCPPNAPLPGCNPPTGYTHIVQVAPAFDVTLPGQINPFSLRTLIAKAETYIEDVRSVTSRHGETGDPVYQPLTIVSWRQEGWHVSGRVRNDTAQPLQQLRIVAVALETCEHKTLDLTGVVLAPGEEISFQLEYSCSSSDLVVLGQGAVVP